MFDKRHNWQVFLVWNERQGMTQLNKTAYYGHKSDEEAKAKEMSVVWTEVLADSRVFPNLKPFT